MFHHTTGRILWNQRPMSSSHHNPGTSALTWTCILDMHPFPFLTQEGVENMHLPSDHSHSPVTTPLCPYSTNTPVPTGSDSCRPLPTREEERASGLGNLFVLSFNSVRWNPGWGHDWVVRGGEELAHFSKCGVGRVLTGPVGALLEEGCVEAAWAQPNQRKVSQLLGANL